MSPSASREMKTYSGSRIELRNPQIFKENAGKIKVVFVIKQPCEPKSLDDTLIVAGVERIRLKNLRLQSTVKAIRFEL